jgi:hypothetical protein
MENGKSEWFTATEKGKESIMWSIRGKRSQITITITVTIIVSSEQQMLKITLLRFIILRVSYWINTFWIGSCIHGNHLAWIILINNCNLMINSNAMRITSMSIVHCIRSDIAFDIVLRPAVFARLADCVRSWVGSRSVNTCISSVIWLQITISELSLPLKCSRPI